MNTKDQNQTVDNYILNTVNRNLLKYAAGRALFCPNCQTCMDWTRTVVATIHATKPGEGEQTLKAYTLCSACWDKLGRHVTGGVEKSAAKLARRG